MKLRVNELATRYNKESKEIMKALKDIGMDVKSHLSFIDDEDKAVTHLNNLYMPRKEQKKPKATLRKKAAPEPEVVEEVQEEIKEEVVAVVEEVKVEAPKVERPKFKRREKPKVEYAVLISQPKPKVDYTATLITPAKKDGAAPTAPSATVASKKDPRRKGKDLKPATGGSKFKKQSFDEMMSARRTHRKKKRQEVERKEEQARSVVSEERIIKCGKEITVKTLAEKLGINPTEIVKHLFMEGKIYSVNNFMPFEVVEEIAMKYNALIEPEEQIEKYKEVKEEVLEGDPRPPIVTVMGHVDHGKTSLLDAIRKTKVTAGEAGGITQQVGAYQVEINDKKITFIDTPGHEAFMDMRARGASVTDIAILVVAADDGVMPQTIEAIAHAKYAKVPVIVAVNKIDKPEANMEKVKKGLSEHGIITTEWGGDNEFIGVSALTGQNIDNLLETVSLQSEMMELKATADQKARAVVLESRLDAKIGPLADVIVQNGTLKIGDPIVVGVHSGKVRYMVNDMGVRVKEAGPSVPVQLSGLSGVPEAGEIVRAVDSDKTARKMAEEQIDKDKQQVNEVFSSTHSLGEQNEKEVRIIIKSGSKGSLEAVRSSLLKIENEEVQLIIVQAATGAVTEGDVKLAKASGASIVAFEVPVNNKIINEAQINKTAIKKHDIIYKLIEDIENTMQKLVDPKFQEVYEGRCDVLKIFKIPKIGTIAGCVVSDGFVTNASHIKVIRNGEELHKGKIISLKRLKDEIKKSDKGEECGIKIENFEKILVGDVLESVKVEQI